MYHANVVPVRDNENNRTQKASLDQFSSGARTVRDRQSDNPRLRRGALVFYVGAQTVFGKAVNRLRVCRGFQDLLEYLDLALKRDPVREERS